MAKSYDTLVHSHSLLNALPCASKIISFPEALWILTSAPPVNCSCESVRGDVMVVWSITKSPNAGPDIVVDENDGDKKMATITMIPIKITLLIINARIKQRLLSLEQNVLSFRATTETFDGLRLANDNEHYKPNLYNLIRDGVSGALERAKYECKKHILVASYICLNSTESRAVKVQ